MSFLRRNGTRWLVVTAVLLFTYLALSSMVDDSPTMDEQNHMARGAAFLRTGDPRLSLEHPPLVNSLSALPLLTLPDLRLPTDQPSWERQPPDVYWYIFAEQFLWDYNRALGVDRMLFLARLPIVYLTIMLALVAYRFALALWGRLAALVAFVLLLFDPNVLANGRYTTTDLGGTLFIFLATFLLWRMWQAAGWEWRRWLLAALGMGLAFGSKLSALAFVPIWGVMALVPAVNAPFTWRAAGRRLAQLLSAGLLAVLVVWVIFGFEWGHFVFLDARLEPLNQLRGPMPTFLGGIERILLLSGGGRPSFLLGEFSNTGFPLYFPVAFGAKTPLLTLLMLALAAVLLLKRRATRSRALFLLLPLVLYYAISTQSALNLGYRHLLPLLPFIYVLIGGGWQLADRQAASAPQKVRLVAAAVAVVMLVQVAVAVGIHPHYLSYFNVAGGGPENGRHILLDSNIDWGQDLLRLRDWMADQGVDHVRLAWFGTADPDYYDISYDPLPGFPRAPFLTQWTNPPFDTSNPEPGVYAISVSNLGELPLAEKNVYPWFRARSPDDRVGYSILIYDLR